MTRQSKAAPDHQGGLKKPEQSGANDTEADGRIRDASIGGLAKPDQAEADAKVDEAVAESFPASDPPAFNRGHSGAPHREAEEGVEQAPETTKRKKNMP